MSTELRESGIGPVGQVPWGTHFCYFYETKEDLLDILVPYFKAGLESNEFCLWVISEPLAEEEAIGALGQAVPDLHQYLEAGTIEIIPHDKWYLKGGVFDLRRVINRWNEKRDQAIARNYAGMRGSGNTSWIQKNDWRDFLEYEKEVRLAVANQRVILSCTFPLAVSGAAEILDVAHFHQFALARRRGEWEIVEVPELKQSKEEIWRMNEELERRVAERTRELEAANEGLRREIAERKEVDEQLRKQKELLQKIIDHIPVMVRFYGEDGRVKLVNREYERTLGWSWKELQEQNVDIYAEGYPDPRDRERVLQFIAAAAGKWADFKTRVRDGRVIDTSWANIRLPDGTTMGIGQDITERKQIEDDLRRQKEILQTIFDLIPVMINFIKEDGQVTLVNREWERVLGWSLEEAVERGMDILSEAYPDPKQRQEALNFISTSHGEWVDFKTRVRDGRVIDTSWAVVHLSDGIAIVFGIDITERKRTEMAEREQRAFAEALCDTAAALNSTLDFEKVLDRILEDVGLVVPHETSHILLIEGDRWRVVRHKGYTERGLGDWIEGLQGSIAERPIFDRVVRSARPLVVPDTRSNSEWLSLPQVTWIRSIIRSPIQAQGKVIGLLNVDSSVPGFFTDSHATRLQAFSDQAAIALENARLLEEVHTGNQRLQALSAQLLVAQETERRSIARELHDEIGQVLTAVGANLQVIELSTDRATRSERLGESINLINNALRQVRDLSLDLRPSLLDDFGLIPALEWYIERQAQRSGFSAEIIANPPEMRVPPNLETTCFRVVQIALTNVTRHADAKNVRVELRLHDTELELVISDDGVGFAVEAALERASRGATLGLLSMQERVRLARGNVEIKSAPGHGTEIHVRFPLD
jgi:PAS domain S-box-containing protein